MALRQTYLSMKAKLPQDVETVLVMRGRGNDELAPSRELLEDFNHHKDECSASATIMGPNLYKCAWDTCDYARRFREQIKGSAKSLERLRKLAEDSRERDIFLICYEAEDKPCHRKLLLDIAREEFGAMVDHAPFGQQPALF